MEQQKFVNLTRSCNFLRKTSLLKFYRNMMIRLFVLTLNYRAIFDNFNKCHSIIELFNKDLIIRQYIKKCKKISFV